MNMNPAGTGRQSRVRIKKLQKKRARLKTRLTLQVFLPAFLIMAALKALETYINIKSDKWFDGGK